MLIAVVMSALAITGFATAEADTEASVTESTECETVSESCGQANTDSVIIGAPFSDL